MNLLNLLFSASKTPSSIESDLERLEGLLVPLLVSLIGVIALLSLV